MATITDITYPCDNHIKLTINHDEKSIDVVITKEEIQSYLAKKGDVKSFILSNLSAFIKKSGVSDWDDLKTLIEAKEFFT